MVGIGIDEIEVDRVGEELSRNSGFRERVFTSREIEYCRSKRYSERKFAARFAAKEAFLKAVGTGLRGGIGLTDIEIVNDDAGRPSLVLHRKALELTRSLGISSIHVSLSHTQHIASAVVTVEK